jgi:putative nucleotidyltransferase with HDIG domain
MALVERAWQAEKSMTCPNVSTDPELAQETPFGHERVRSMMCVVLRTPHGKLGVMQFARLCADMPFQPRDEHLAELLCKSTALTLESVRGLIEQERRHLLQTLTALAQAIELRDEYTSGHTHRVTKYAELLAEELHLPSSSRQLLQVGTPLHDIGKIGISDAILRKPGPLTPEEMEYMKSHTIKGAQMLEIISSLAPLLPIVRSHHERWDGSGYPDGLQRDQIPPLGRIVALADAFDAMTSDRPYRAALPMDHVFDEVQQRAGSQFDPEFAKVFVQLRPRLVEIQQTPVAPLGTTPSGVLSLAREYAAGARHRTLARPRPLIRSRSR